MLPKTLTLIILTGALLSSATARSDPPAPAPSPLSPPPPIHSPPPPPPPPPPPSPYHANVPDYVTQEFFDEIMSKSGSSCLGHGFYTRDAFLDALAPHPEFATQDTKENAVREIAAFFAHVTYKTKHLCLIEEQYPLIDYCNSSYEQYPCAAGQSYHGRGPIQLQWNYNYGAAAESITFNGLKHPDTLVEDVVVSFNAALWFWNETAHSVVKDGFLETILAVDSIECKDGEPGPDDDRVAYYTDYCKRFGVSHGEKLYCQ